AVVVKRTVGVPGCILNCASDESCFGREPDRFGHDFGRIAKALFQIRRDGQIRGIDDQPSVRQSLVSCQPAISFTNDACRSSAGRCQCLEAKPGEQAGGGNIPWIWNYEGPRPLM